MFSKATIQILKLQRGETTQDHITWVTVSPSLLYVDDLARALVEPDLGELLSDLLGELLVSLAFDFCRGVLLGVCSFSSGTCFISLVITPFLMVEGFPFSEPGDTCPVPFFLFLGAAVSL